MGKKAKDKFLELRTPSTKEEAYILGLLWADGSLYSNKCHNIRIEINSDDATSLKSVFNKSGPWRKYSRQRQDNWQPTITYYCNDQFLFSYLNQFGYQNKDGIACLKLLNSFPNELRQYWYRGYWDGDGCFYTNRKHYLYQTTASGPLGQDWDFLEALYDKLGIKYSIRRASNANSYSAIRTSGKSDFMKLGNYLYGNAFDKIGLQRKYHKFSEFI